MKMRMKRLADFHFNIFFLGLCIEPHVGEDMATPGQYDGYLGPQCRHHGICLGRLYR